MRVLSRWLLQVVALGGCFLAESRAQELASPALSAISIGHDAPLIKAGYLEQDDVGARQALSTPVVISVQNRSGKACATSVEITGRNADFAGVELVKTEDTAEGQALHLKVIGKQPTLEDTQTLLTIEARQDNVVKAKKSLPIRVVVPASIKLPQPTVYEGLAVPGLVNRALNMRTTPKAAVPYPMAKLASMCLHDLTLTALDQFGDALPAIYEGTAVWAALGKHDYEPTNRRLRKDSTWVDTLGLWQFVGEVKDVTVDPERSAVQEFVSKPAPPCTEQQFAAYDPLIVQWSVGGHPVGTFERQITLIDSGDAHKPHLKVTLTPTTPGPVRTATVR